MNICFHRHQCVGAMGGWRRLFLASTALLTAAACGWAWHVRKTDWGAWQTAEYAPAL